ncbi:MAG: hypothetical protein F4X27_02445 [Chloroflexi bacterium]|nr:hypothetical protein [Chloroflexota bacterium]
MQLGKSKATLVMLVIAAAMAAALTVMSFTGAQADETDGEPVSYTPGSSSLTLTGLPEPGGACDTNRRYRVTVRTFWYRLPYAVEKSTVQAGDAWPEELTIDGLDPGLFYWPKVKAMCEDAQGSTISEVKEFGGSGGLRAPGYMPHQPFAYMTGTADKVKFHILPNSICDEFILQYRARGRDEWTQQHVSNNYPGTSDWHQDFWMYQIDNADPGYRAARIECVYDNLGTDTEPDYQTTTLMSNSTIWYD